MRNRSSARHLAATQELTQQQHTTVAAAVTLLLPCVAAARGLTTKAGLLLAPPTPHMRQPETTAAPHAVSSISPSLPAARRTLASHDYDYYYGYGYDYYATDYSQHSRTDSSHPPTAHDYAPSQYAPAGDGNAECTVHAIEHEVEVAHSASLHANAGTCPTASCIMH